ncbi:hypothetical protein AVEN_89830-1 [Araneus ventricosus]|uniref:Uncharacterized protein n=1 Tax=Araneus ventricosus TaxID=182803 RepID=A0A4Y2SSC6_ARAVE|nr:hypothetical protein AVEN_89830-1 [Araneus ventricosus]
MEEQHNVVFQLPNSLENTSCTKPLYFRVIQYIRVFRLHGLKKISKLAVSKPTRSNSIYKFHDCIKHGFHIQCRFTQSILMPHVRSNSPILDSHMSAPRERDNACWRQSTAITNKELPLLTLYRLKAVCLLIASIEYALRLMYRNTSLRCG